MTEDVQYLVTMTAVLLHTVDVTNTHEDEYNDKLMKRDTITQRG